MITQVIILGAAVVVLSLFAWWLTRCERAILRSGLAEEDLYEVDENTEIEWPLGVQHREAIDEEAIRDYPNDGKTAVCRYCEIRVPLSFMRSIDVEDGIFDQSAPFAPFRDVADAPCEFFCAHCLDAEDYPSTVEPTP